MGSETVIIRWCDVCAAEKPDADKVEAEQVSVHAGGFKVDLCQKHRRPFDEVTALISTYGYRETASGITPATPKAKATGGSGRPGIGRPGTTKITDPGAKVCPECFRPFSGSNGLSTLRNHMLSIHKVPRTKYSPEELTEAAEEAKEQALAMSEAQAPLVKAG